MSEKYDKFMDAVKTGNFEEAELYFEKDFVDKGDKYDRRPIHLAITGGNVKILQLLIDNGCDKEAIEKNGMKAIHRAAEKGQVDILKMLIDSGCDLYSLTRTKQSILDLVNQGFNKDCVLLVEQALENIHKNTPLNERKLNIRVPYLKGDDLLGEGGFGAVYKYFDIETLRTLAVKKFYISPIPSDLDKEAQFFEKEISIYKKLGTHPKIVNYFGNIKDEEVMYIFTEYFEAGSIKMYYTANGPLTSPMISWYLKQILEGLAFLHKNKIIHRNIKCSNILRDDKENIKICDFGLSKSLEGTSSKKSDKKAKTTCGTWYFTAPEVLDGAEYGVWADIWSLGATVVEMLIANHPLPKMKPIQAIVKILSTKTMEYDPPQPISTIFKTFIDRMLTGDPKDRATVEELQKSEFILNTPKTVEEITERFVKK